MSSSLGAPHYYPADFRQPEPKNGLAIAALSLGVGGMVIGLIPILGMFAIALGAVGSILAIVAMHRVRRHLATNKWTARLGFTASLGAIVLGIVGTVIVAGALNDVDDALDKADRDIGRATELGADAATTAPTATEVERSIERGVARNLDAKVTADCPQTDAKRYSCVITEALGVEFRVDVTVSRDGSFDWVIR